MISVKNLSKKYKNKEIFNDVCLSINKNKLTFLMGNNGSGKTTFIKCLTGLEKVQGEILFDGKVLDEIRSEIGVVYDDSPLYLNLSGLKNIELLCNNCSYEDIKLISNEFQFFEKLKAKTSQYSYGQKKFYQ